MSTAIRILCAAVRLGSASGEAARRWDKSGSSELRGEQRGSVVRVAQVHARAARASTGAAGGKGGAACGGHASFAAACVEAARGTALSEVVWQRGRPHR